MASTSQSSPKVVILGGGFCGPALAITLANHGITSAVYDLRPEGDKQGGNISLAPNALRVLNVVGIYDDLRRTAYNFQTMKLSTAKGGELGEFMNGSQRRYNYDALRAHRRDVRDLLLKRMNDKGVPIHYNMKVSRIVSDSDDGATVEFADGTQVSAEFIVGCDGIHSKTRSYIYPDATPVYQGAMGLMGVVTSDQLEDILGPVGQQHTSKWPVTLPRMTFGDHGMFGTFPADFAGLEFGFMTAQPMPKDKTRDEWAALEQNKPELKNLLECAFLDTKSGVHYPKEVQTLVERVRPESINSWPFYVVPQKETWYSKSGRVIFIGDAAHAIPPTGGQGAAMAFEDAVTLGLTLTRYYSPNPMPNIHTNAPDLTLLELLQKWCRHRKDRVQQVFEFTTRNGEYMKASPMYFQQVAKEWAIWASLKVAGAEAGASWLYSYTVENVLGALAS